MVARQSSRGERLASRRSAAGQDGGRRRVRARCGEHFGLVRRLMTGPIFVAGSTLAPIFSARTAAASLSRTHRARASTMTRLWRCSAARPGEGRAQQRGDGEIEIGVGQHHRSILAAHFGLQADSAAGQLARQAEADFGGAVEGHTGQLGMADDGLVEGGVS